MMFETGKRYIYHIGGPILNVLFADGKSAYGEWESNGVRVEFKKHEFAPHRWIEYVEPKKTVQELYVKNDGGWFYATSIFEGTPPIGKIRFTHTEGQGLT